MLRGRRWAVNFIQLTRPDGELVLINPEYVEEVMPAGKLNRGAQTMIVFATGFQFVKEPPDVVAQKLGIKVSS